MNRERENFPTAIEATFLVISLFAIEFAISAFLHDIKSVSGIDPRNVAGAIAVLSNGVLFTVLLHFKRTTYSSIFHSSKKSVAAVMLSLSLPVLMIIPAMTLAVWTVEAVLFQFFPVAHWQEAMFDHMMSNGFASLVTVCLLAPVLEEMLFRGVILRSFLHQYSRWTAILGSAFLFGLAHLNVYQFAAGLFIGTILGWLYERTRSLWPSILLHGAYNIAVTAIYYAEKNGELAQFWQPSLEYWTTAFAFAFVGTISLQRLLPVQDARQ